MSGFLRRFTTIPTLAVIKQIEGVVVIDLAPPDPTTGAGTGNVLLVGEFEDGFFATDDEAKGAVEVFGSEDMRAKFGEFGYQYGQSIAQNPSARRHLQEFWNGNGYLKAFGLRAQRLFVSRVDTSVGQVAFDPLASIDGGTGPFVIPNSTAIGFTSNLGAATATAITGVPATEAGAAGTFAMASGDTALISVDGSAQVSVVFSAADSTPALCIARINAALGYTAAALNAGEIDITALTPGTSSRLILADGTPGTLAKLGHTAGTTSGTGNVANRNAVTVAELVTIINATVGLGAVDVKASQTPTGALRVYNETPGGSSTISATAAANGSLVGFTEGLVVSADDHLGGSIPAGTRVSDGTSTWVVMQTLDVAATVLGPYMAKVRPALDDGTATGAAANTVTTLVDTINFATLVVRNPSALTVAKTEAQMDAAYEAALAATLEESAPAREANYLLSARRSDAVVAAGKANVIRATECGLNARIFITRDPIGTSLNTIFANVERYRSDRVFYTGKGWRVRIPQISVVGTAGGLGFTADGVITVGPDGPLTTLCAMLAPEENPGQRTNLIDQFFAVDNGGETLSLEAYEAAKRLGVALPRVDRVSGSIYQSGVSSSLDTGRTTMARRKMADFIQNTAGELFGPFVKKLNRQSRRDKVRSIWEQFLGSLQSVDNPEQARIEAFSVDDSRNAGNTPEVLAQGVYYLQTKVRTLSSMDDIVVQTEIGENAVISVS